MICGAVGRRSDGLPIVVSQRVAGTLTGSQFRVVTAAGQTGAVACATLAPADDPQERRTILLVGDLGSPSDPPAGVEIVESLLLDGGGNALGARTEVVTPLDDGPSLVLAEAFLPAEVDGDSDDRCPDAETAMVVKTTWQGGVTAPDGNPPAEMQRLGTEVAYADGTVDMAFALADVGDRDNHVDLCLSRSETPVEVRAAAGLYVDPNGDANPETKIAVHPG